MMSMIKPVSRRTFLGGAVAAGAAWALPGNLWAAAGSELGFPLIDLHVHLDNSSIDQVLPLSKERGVKFGIVEHAGTKENKYPVVLSNDEELKGQIKMLEGKGVYKGVQTEWNDWMKCFSKEALAQLDYILTDTMTFPGKNGQRVKLWEDGVEDRVEMANRQAFMDRYVEWHLEIITKQPIDLLANVSWLPAPLANEYDTFWTEKRIQKVIDAAIKYQVALEISSSYELPKLRFLKMAKEAGIKFTFGSNGRYPKMGQLAYSIAMAKELGLKASDMFTPAPDGQKAAQRRVY
ncbi:MAG: twin-arginine translocation signal domain-containing protein [Bacillota bacterium]